jgi:hypothetical protein
MELPQIATTLSRSFVILISNNPQSGLFPITSASKGYSLGLPLLSQEK